MVKKSVLEQKLKRVEHGLEPFVENKKDSNFDQKNIHERMNEFNVPGVSIAVINDSKVELARGYGLLEMGADLQVTPNSIFCACSMSKFVTTMAVLVLVQDGTLDLDEEVNNKLSSWKIPENEFTQEKSVTLRHLLSHQAGITDSEGSFDVYQAGDPVPTSLDVLNGSTKYNSKSIRIEYLPGSKFEYSDAGYCVIEQLLVDVTGKPFDALVAEQILKPLGMINSSYQFDFEFSDTAQVAVGHNKHGEVVDGKGVNYPYMSGSGLRSTPTDLSLLVIELHHLLKRTGKLQISPLLAKGMLTQQGAAAWAGMGVFLGQVGEQVIMETFGWGVGAQCMISAYPYVGAGVVVMTNSDPACHQDKALIGELIRSVKNEYNWNNT